MNELKSYLTYIEDVGRDTKGRLLGRYNCICGKQVIVLVTNVKRFNTKSCGCERYKSVSTKNKRHGLRKHPLYSIWSNIKKRCYNKKDPHYFNYGGRGIDMYPLWVNNFKLFYDWCINNGWDNKLQTDRIDNSKGYFPYNIRFVSPKINSNNRRDNKWLTYKGESKPLQEWATLLSIPSGTISSRIHKSKWSVEKSLSTPVQINGAWGLKPVICLNTGEIFNSLKEAAESINANPISISQVCRGERKSIYKYKFNYV